MSAAFSPHQVSQTARIEAGAASGTVAAPAFRALGTPGESVLKEQVLHLGHEGMPTRSGPEPVSAATQQVELAGDAVELFLLGHKSFSYEEVSSIQGPVAVKFAHCDRAEVHEG